MNKLMTLLTILVLVSSCEDKNRPIKYTYLDKLSGKTLASYGKNGDRFIYIETILIDNPPSNFDEALRIQREYFNKNNKINILEDDISSYVMTFYEKTGCTDYFITNTEDPGGFSSRSIGESCAEDGQASFYYSRDLNNPNKWILSQNFSEKKFSNTIYCKPNRKKVKLPDLRYNE